MLDRVIVLPADLAGALRANDLPQDYVGVFCSPGVIWPCQLMPGNASTMSVKEGFAFGEHSSLVTENYKQLFANSLFKKWQIV